MFRILILIMFGLINLQASTTPAISLINQSMKKSISQDKDMSGSEYSKMIKSLEAAYNMGDKSKAYILGLAYSQKHILTDKVINIDINKALRWFRRSLNAGYGLAALQIALLYYLPNNQIYSALSILEEGLKSNFIDSDGKVTLSLAYGGIVLEKLNSDKKYIEKAIEFMYPIASQRNISTLDYTLANLLNLDNQTKLANKFLNSACNNPNVPKKIWNMCISGSEIAVVDNSTGLPIKKKRNGCPAKKLLPGL